MALTPPLRYVEPVHRPPREADSPIPPVTDEARLLAQLRPAIEAPGAAAPRPVWRRGS